MGAGEGREGKGGGAGGGNGVRGGGERAEGGAEAEPAETINIAGDTARDDGGAGTRDADLPSTRDADLPNHSLAGSESDGRRPKRKRNDEDKAVEAMTKR